MARSKVSTGGFHCVLPSDGWGFDAAEPDFEAWAERLDAFGILLLNFAFSSPEKAARSWPDLVFVQLPKGWQMRSETVGAVMTRVEIWDSVRGHSARRAVADIYRDGAMITVYPLLQVRTAKGQNDACEARCVQVAGKPSDVVAMRRHLAAGDMEERRLSAVQASKEAEAELQAYLDRSYPDWKDPAAYWKEYAEGSIDKNSLK